MKSEAAELFAAFPLPISGEHNQLDLSGMSEAYRRVAETAGSKGQFWHVWIELQRLLDRNWQVEIRSFSSRELKWMTKWARVNERREFRIIFETFFRAVRSEGDYPVQENTIYYLDLLLSEGRYDDVVSFVEAHFPILSKKECFWERSRLVLALARSGFAQRAQTEWLQLARVLGAEAPDIIALRACIEDALGKEESAKRLAKESVCRGMSDESLEATVKRIASHGSP